MANSRDRVLVALTLGIGDASGIAQKEPLGRLPSSAAGAADLPILDDEAPVVSGAGELYDLNGEHVSGMSTYSVSIAARDPGLGVKRVALERVGSGELAASDAPCLSIEEATRLNIRVCPVEHSLATTLDGSALPEGETLFMARAFDFNGNEGTLGP
jgi:hypothetical protein